MKKEVLYSFRALYRDQMNIYGYRFGKGEKAACVVGALRGNEVQQMYICSQLVRALSELEEHGAIAAGKEILVVPSVNHYSMNVGKRFWTVDQTDINRRFPGYENGEPTQRIADGLFREIREYSYGIQFTSFYMDGDFVPHVRMMETGYQNPSLANLFGLPYVMVRKPNALDTSTLNYHWQMWDTSAFSIYANGTDQVDEVSAQRAVSAVLRFLTRMGILRYNSSGGYIATVLYEQDLMSVRSDAAGIYRRFQNPGDEVRRGDLRGEVLHSQEGTVLSRIQSPTDGILFFAHGASLVSESQVLFKIIRRLHL